MKTFTLLLFIGITFISFGQTTIFTQKNIGGAGDDGLTMYKAPNANGYYFLGTSNSNSSFDKTENSRGGNDLWIVRTDDNFNVLWDKTIGGSGDDRFADCIITDTAIYCILTTSSPPSGEITETSYGFNDILILKLDLNGNILNQKRYGGSEYDSANSLRVWGNHFLLIGASNSPISGSKTIAQIGGADWWFLELNATDLSILSQKVIGSTTGEHYLGSVELNNELFVMGFCLEGVGGDKTDNGYGASDVWIVKLNTSLDIVSNKCFGGDFSEEPAGFITTDGENIYFVNSSYSQASGNKTSPNRGTFDGNSRSDFWVVKLDPNLNKIWENTYGGTHDDNPTSLFIEDDILILGGTSRSVQNSGNKTASSYGVGDVYLVALDSSGVELGQYSFGGTGSEGGGIFQKNGDTLFLAGSSNSPISGNKTVGTNGLSDSWIIKFKMSYLNTPEFSDITKKVQVYPNPFHEQVNFEFLSISSHTELIIYTTDGREVDRMTIPKGASSITWNPTCESGVYLYSINEESGRIFYQK